MPARLHVLFMLLGEGSGSSDRETRDWRLDLVQEAAARLGLLGRSVMTSSSATRDRMKTDWDARARQDLFRYVDHRAASDAQFDALGERDAELLLSDVGTFLDPPRQAAVEIGCGPGRLLKPLAARFREVWGTDISSEMVEWARRRLRGVERVRVVETAGDDLEGVPAGHFAFCCSAFVFECIPDRDIIRRNLEEAHRVLASGGLLKFNAAGVFAHNPFRGHYDAHRDTWAGARFTMAELVGMTEECGLVVPTSGTVC